MNEFNLALGLLDYCVPIIYGTFTFFMIRLLMNKTSKVIFISYCIGAIISLMAGLTVPTIKCLLGTKVLMDADLIISILSTCVFLTNIGILISGTSLYLSTREKFHSTYVASFAFPIVMLAFKPTNIAIVIGIIGIILIYISIVKIGLKTKYKLPFIFVGISLVLIISLGVIGMACDTLQASTHWAIEIINICSQSALMTSGILTYLHLNKSK